MSTAYLVRHCTSMYGIYIISNLIILHANSAVALCKYDCIESLLGKHSMPIMVGKYNAWIDSVIFIMKRTIHYLIITGVSLVYYIYLHLDTFQK